MIKCRDEGTLLGYLDRELPPEEMKAIRQHLDYCPRCSNLLREIEDNLEFSQHKLGQLSPTEESVVISGQEQVWARLQPALPSREKGRNYMNLKRWSIAAALVLILGVTAYVPSFRTAVADLLQVFRVEKMQTLTLTSQDMMAIQNALEQGGSDINLENFGRIETSGETQERKISRTEITQLLPFKPLLAANQEGEYRVVKTPSVVITPKVDNVNQLLKSLGSEDLLPRELDGQTFKVTMADTFVADYKDYTLMAGTSPELQVPPGVDMKAVLRPLINLPIWPQGVREQLATIDDLEHTLVVPGQKVEKVSVNGSPAIISRDGAATLIWQNQGLFYILNDKSGGKADLVAAAESLE